VAAGNAAGYLRDDKGAHVEFRVLLAVMDQRTGHLFRSHQADVGDEVTVDGVRHIDVEHDPRKIGAVMEEQVEVANIAAIVEDGDESLILGR
jgi:hypothetical protein